MAAPWDKPERLAARGCVSAALWGWRLRFFGNREARSRQNRHTVIPVKAEIHHPVIPAKAGIHFDLALADFEAERLESRVFGSRRGISPLRLP
jgi:hypothetical protein